jgi:ABC-type antimicrobial peptide transport system permease subunit
VLFAAASAIVFGAVCAASIVPAWRAARVNPINALRSK